MNMFHFLLWVAAAINCNSFVSSSQHHLHRTPLVLSSRRRTTTKWAFLVRGGSDKKQQQQRQQPNEISQYCTVGFINTKGRKSGSSSADMSGGASQTAQMILDELRENDEGCAILAVPFKQRQQRKQTTTAWVGRSFGTADNKKEQRKQAEGFLQALRVMALISQVLVVRLDTRNGEIVFPPTVVKSLKEIIQNQGVPKTIIIWIDDDNNNDPDNDSGIEAMTQRFLQKHSSWMNPTSLQGRLEIVSSLQEVSSVIDDVILSQQQQQQQEKDDVWPQHDVPIESLGVLANRVHRALHLDALPTLFKFKPRNDKEAASSLSSSSPPPTSSSSASTTASTSPSTATTSSKTTATKTSTMQETVAPIQSVPVSPSRQTSAKSVNDSDNDFGSTLEEQVVQVESAVMERASNQIDALEQKLQRVLLDGTMPILEFGSDAEKILKDAQQKFNTLVQYAQGNISMRKLIQEKLEDVRQRLVENIEPLFDQQLNSLREHYGKKYETILEAAEEKGGDERQSLLREAASQISDGFRTAAKNAIPTSMEDSFDYVSVLHGLLDDMMEATSMREPEDDIDIDDDEALQHGKKRRPTWYKKLAARALALGVNYFQGWLALQGIRRAAIERDKKFPKFPLF